MIDWCFFLLLKTETLHFSHRPYFWIWGYIWICILGNTDCNWYYLLIYICFEMKYLHTHIWRMHFASKKVDSCSWFENLLCANLNVRGHAIQISLFLSCLWWEENKAKQSNPQLKCLQSPWDDDDIGSPSCLGLIFHLQLGLQLISNTPTLIAPV